MRISSEEEERAHQRVVARAGAVGGALGLAGGLAAVGLASRRWAAVRSLTLPFRTFLVTSAAAAAFITTAEHRSITFRRERARDAGYVDAAARQAATDRARLSPARRAAAWVNEHRLAVVGGSWLASIAVALRIVSRDRLLTASQKAVQARMYAQAVTIVVMIAVAVLEYADAQSGKGRWETVLVVDPDDPESKRLIEKRIHREEYKGQDQWMDMVAAEERRLARKKASDEQPPK